MNAFEKLVDRMGQAIFRIETNFEGVQRRLPPGPMIEPAQAITTDLENLKAIKADLAKGMVDDLAKACEMIMGVRYVMTFIQIHDQISAKEVLDKYGAPSVQQLAQKAQDLAEKALKAWEEANK